MKKALWILLLVVGLGALFVGVVTVQEATAEEASFAYRIQSGLDESYSYYNTGKKTQGVIFAIGGIIALIASITALAQKKKTEPTAQPTNTNENVSLTIPTNQVKNTNTVTFPEQELQPLASVSTPPLTQNTNTVSTDDKLNQLEKLGKLKEQGLLTEEEFTAQKKNILG